MTLGDAAVAVDERAMAFGYAQRRSWIFWAWWYGVVLAITGAAEAGLSILLGQDPSPGMYMALLGAPLSVFGWLLTLGLRFSKKLPKPAKDVSRVEQAIRLNPGVVRFLVAAAVLVGAAMVLLTPNGRSPEALPCTALVVTAILSVTAGSARSGWLMKNSGELYSRWLERRQPRSPGGSEVSVREA